DAARCATCHTQERCASCHVDAERPEIERIPAAPATMELPVAVAHYNRPATHVDPAWLGEHGGRVSRTACATCHTSDDCMSCHVEQPPAAALLPSRDQTAAPGVRLTAHAPDNHDSRFFLEVHGTLAAASAQTCATCHEESFCVSCHDGPAGGGYHPPNFVARHTAPAFGRDTDCANCHNTQAFCLECHQQSGLTSFGRSGPGYHDGGPFWLIRHGQAARQNLESCASCHEQTDCTRCHGALGAFKVSPHAPDFDAAAAWARSPRTCLACHVGNPLTGSPR
ncbi:MAG: hypothetical protein KC544_15470, partial [Gemmatimonadetes bacterium]|nr:hypothetical protein [Gemmatimonadota bacterium]